MVTCGMALRQRIKTVEQFNQTTRRLVRKVVNMHPDDIFMSSADQRVRIAIDTHPELMICNVGGYIWQHREAIARGDSSWLSCPSHDQITPNNKEIFYLLNKIKETILSETQPKPYYDLIQKLLKTYQDYIAIDALI